MGVPFKKIPRRDPRKEDAVAKFYPQLVTLGDNADLEDVAYVMKEKSSLTLGDIKSVITNFVEALIDKLYGGTSRISGCSACQRGPSEWRKRRIARLRTLRP